MEQTKNMYEDQLKKIDKMLTDLRRVKSEIKKTQKLSEKVRQLTPQNSTLKKITDSNASLSWQCMALEKVKIDFARAFENSLLDVGTEKRTFHPSGFHSYEY